VYTTDEAAPPLMRETSRRRCPAGSSDFGACSGPATWSVGGWSRRPWQAM